MLEENKRYADFVGLTPYLAAGCKGQGVLIGSGENWLLSGHGLDTYNCFKEFAPDADVVYIPMNVTETENKFFTQGISLIKEKGLLGMWASLILDFDVPTIDRMLKDVSPYFFCATAIGNDGTHDYSGICDAERIYGIGAYTLMANPTTAIPSGYSSVAESLDFVMPGNLYLPNQYGYGIPQSGTSFADPFFMAVYAVMQSYFMARLGHYITADNMYDFFVDHRVDMSISGKDPKKGWGRIKLPAPDMFDVKKYGGGSTVIKMFVGSKIMTVNGVEQTLDQVPVAMTDTQRVLVPIRAPFEAAGFVVEWDNPSQTVTLTR